VKTEDIGDTLSGCHHVTNLLLSMSPRHHVKSSQVSIAETLSPVMSLSVHGITDLTHAALLQISLNARRYTYSLSNFPRLLTPPTHWLHRLRFFKFFMWFL